VIAIDERAMIAVLPMTPDHLGARARSLRRGNEPRKPAQEMLPAEEPSKSTAQFQPLDPSVVNEAIPAFFIGRNQKGFWVARDVKGEIGGIFLFESSAVSFARRNGRPAGCATIFQTETFELDLENKGNPLIIQLGELKHLATCIQQRLIAFIDKLMQTVRNRGDFHAP
jgi:hypothetical protein